MAASPARTRARAAAHPRPSAPPPSSGPAERLAEARATGEGVASAIQGQAVKGATRVGSEAYGVARPAIGLGWYVAGLGLLLIVAYYVLAKPRATNAVIGIAKGGTGAARVWIAPYTDPLAALRRTLRGEKAITHYRESAGEGGGEPGANIAPSEAPAATVAAQRQNLNPAFGPAPGVGTPLQQTGVQQPRAVGRAARPVTLPGTPYPQPNNLAQSRVDRAFLEGLLAKREAQERERRALGHLAGGLRQPVRSR